MKEVGVEWTDLIESRNDGSSQRSYKMKHHWTYNTSTPVAEVLHCREDHGNLVKDVQEIEDKIRK